MAIKFKNLEQLKNDNATGNDSSASNPAKSKPSEEAVELMEAIHDRQTKGGTPVSRPGDVFKVLTEQLGFQRTEEQNKASQAREFVTAVRRQLISKKKRSPTYDEVLGVMRTLGYERA